MAASQRFLGRKTQVVLAQRNIHAPVRDPRRYGQSDVAARGDNPPDIVAGAFDEIGDQRDRCGIAGCIVQIVDDDRACTVFEVFGEPVRKLQHRLVGGKNPLVHRGKRGECPRRYGFQYFAQMPHEGQQGSVLSPYVETNVRQG